VTHTFDYDEAAVAALKATIERVAHEIYTLAFWDQECDETECQYCRLRAMIGEVK
jgi:hypothetical protein